MSKKSLVIRGALDKLNFDLILIVITPLLLLSFNKTWIFSPHGLADPWIYLGHFLRLDQHLNVFTGTYYITRLSWIIPGYITYRLFPPLIANYVLHLGFYYIAAISLYLTLKYTINRRAALLATILMSCYSYFLLAIGWDYVDGVGIAYFLLTVLMLTRAAMFSHSKIWLFLGGFFYAALIYSNTGWGIFTPSLVIYFLLINFFSRRRLIFTSLFFSALGFLCLTLLLGAISYSINRQFLFFLPSFTFSMESIGQASPWKVDWRTWIPHATWLILPCLTFLASIATLLVNLRVNRSTRFTINNSSICFFQIFFILNFLVMVFLEVRGVVILQLVFYASYLIPSMFLAIAAQLANVINRLKSQQYWAIVGSTLILAILSYSVWFEKTYLYVFSGLACVAGLCLLFSSKTSIYKPLIQQLVTAVLIFTVYSFASDQTILIVSGGTIEQEVQLALNVNNVDTQAPHFYPAKEDDFLTVVEAQNILKVIDPGVNYLFWYNNDESPVYRSISSACLWGYRLVGEKFPRLGLGTGFPDPQPNVEQLQPLFKVFPKVVILSKRKDVFQQGSQALSQMGFGAKFLFDQEIHHGAFSLVMTFIEVTQK